MAGGWELRLYVAGATPASQRAIRNLGRLRERLPGCRVEIVDLYQRPERARADAIVVAPTLIRLRPLPVARFVGDLDDTTPVLECTR